MLMRCVTIICLLLVFSACERNHSRYPLHEAPVFDEEFYSISLEKVNSNIRENPENPENYYRKAIILNELGRSENALVNLRRAISLDADEPVYHYLAAREILKIGNVDEAEEFAAEAERLGEQSGGLFHLLSSIHQYRGNHIKAADYVNKAMKQEPENPAYLRTRGYIMLALEDTLAAEQDFKASLDMQEDPATYDGLVQIYLSRNDTEKAGFYLKKQLAAEPQNLEANLRMVTLLNSLSYADSSANLLAELFERFPEDNRAALKLADYLYLQRQYDSAEYYTDWVLSRDLNNTDALLRRARLLNANRQYGESLAAYTTLLDIDSTDQIAIGELADLRRKIAYLQQLERRRRNTLPTLEKKDSDLEDNN